MEPAAGSHMLADWPASYEALLRKHLPFLEPGRALAPDASLTGLGLASLETVALLLDIEEQFNVEIPDELLTQETFETPVSLWQVITTQRVPARGAEPPVTEPRRQ